MTVFQIGSPESDASSTVNVAGNAPFVPVVDEGGLFRFPFQMHLVRGGGIVAL